MIYIYVDPINVKFPGFNIISKQILKYIPGSKVITDLSGIDKSATILPMGVVAGMDIINKGYPCDTIFYIDALTLGFSSIAKFGLSHGTFFTKSCIRNALKYVKYCPIERKIINSFKKVVVVSPHDQRYLENKYNVNNIYTVMNGVSFPDISKLKEKYNSDSLTLGLLYYWGCSAIDDIDWFVKSYLPKLRVLFPNLKIIAAGRGSNERVLKYLESNKIEFIGDVEHLYDFFNQIDVFVSTVRKECGILNKILDAFAHKTIVLGMKQNMYPFEAIKECYFSFESLDEFEYALRYIMDNPTDIRKKTEYAYNYLLEQHNWEHNIKKLHNIILENK